MRWRETSQPRQGNTSTAANSGKRPDILFAVAAVLAVTAIAACYVLGVFGPIAWRAIDAVRLLAPILFLAAVLMIFTRYRRGLVSTRRAIAICGMAVVMLTPLIINSSNLLVQVAACAVILLAACMAVTILFASRAKAKAI